MIFSKIIKILIIRFIFIVIIIRWLLLKFVRKEIIIRLGKDRLIIPTSDNGISRDLWLNSGIREPFLEKKINRAIKEGDTVIDIGANIGFYAIQESIMVGDYGRVYAIEPVKRNFVILKKNVRINKVKNIHFYNFAIGGTNNSKGIIYISKKLNWSTLITNHHKQLQITSKQITKIFSLDYLIGKRIIKKPDIIRMDVEGYAPNIIQGMRKLLRQSKRLKIFIELHFHLTEKKELEKMIFLLRKNNFRATWAAREPSVEQIFISKRKIFNKLLSHFLNWELDLNKCREYKIGYNQILNRYASENQITHFLFEK